MNPDFPPFLLEAKQPSEGGPVFVAQAPPLSWDEIAAAEQALGIWLPQSYKAFVSVLGPGLWCGDAVKEPASLYAFDADCGDMEGFVALVENVQGVGDYLAIDPAAPTSSGEWTLHYCGHESLGSRPAADSFESWARRALVARRADESPYAAIEGVTVHHHADAHAGHTRPWWQFWR